MTLNFLPPQNWQDFESFVKGTVEVIWKQQAWHLYGRQGQAQSGIDIFGYDNNQRNVGIQCKKKAQTNSDGELLKNSLLTKSLIQEEIKSASKIKSPKLDRLIFATTSSRDTKIQDIIRDENSKNQNLDIEIWFWEDFQILIERNIELMYWYYKDYLQNIEKYNPDIHILTLYKQAFNRPAFQRAMYREESGGDFLQAIKNTQEAIKTGRLYNRRGDLITSSFPTNKLSKAKWIKDFDLIYSKLDLIRDLFNKGIKDNKIIQHQTLIEFRDDDIINELNEKRAECLTILNNILKDNQLELVKSELI
ncbi:hypothetical protein [Winogradskyella helgolandensis]|uniref:hypothetical protein n=1 Tax=Winogradskyella helgolandensis TaxID=2697010 RepID=UPI0015BD57D9|nr:hypothetical protein [Winogradskyella helgolandensis]